LVATLGQSPEPFGHAQSRWTLQTILSSCAWLRLKSLGGLCQLLERLDIGLKRGRHYVHSPDQQYGAKLAYVQRCWQSVVNDPERCVLVYLDEVGYERQPSLAQDYGPRGQAQMPLARRTYQTNRVCRGIGALNALTGQVTYRQHSRISTHCLARFYADLAATYPHAETIFAVQDNWSVHVHPDVLAVLQPQRSPFFPPLSAFWTHLYRPDLPTGQLPIQMIFLPTYAPWLNPIEKLWRYLKQKIIHLHRLADAWPTLKERVLTFMRQFEQGSFDLLRYVGLLPY
jgi:hypothetical protein